MKTINMLESSKWSAGKPINRMVNSLLSQNLHMCCLLMRNSRFIISAL